MRGRPRVAAASSLWTHRRERPDRAPEREPERRILAYLSTGSAARAREAGAQQISPQAARSTPPALREEAFFFGGGLGVETEEAGEDVARDVVGPQVTS